MPALERIAPFVGPGLVVGVCAALGVGAILLAAPVEDTTTSDGGTLTPVCIVTPVRDAYRGVPERETIYCVTGTMTQRQGAPDPRGQNVRLVQGTAQGCGPQPMWCHP